MAGPGQGLNSPMVLVSGSCLWLYVPVLLWACEGGSSVGWWLLWWAWHSSPGISLSSFVGVWINFITQPSTEWLFCHRWDSRYQKKIKTQLESFKCNWFLLVKLKPLWKAPHLLLALEAVLSMFDVMGCGRSNDYCSFFCLKEKKC